MDSFKQLVQYRRSHRAFTPEKVSKEDLNTILRAGLMSPSAMHRRSWQFIVVEDESTIAQLAKAKASGAQFLNGAPLAIVVAGKADNDCWLEDCSIAAVTMQYQAADLGLGSCWAQMHGRTQADGTMAEDVIRQLLHIPANVNILCVLGIGYSTDERKPQDEGSLKWENVHNNQW